jgi:hypothetical protein
MVAHAKQKSILQLESKLIEPKFYGELHAPLFYFLHKFNMLQSFKGQMNFAFLAHPYRSPSLEYMFRVGILVDLRYEGSRLISYCY